MTLWRWALGLWFHGAAVGAAVALVAGGNGRAIAWSAFAGFQVGCFAYNAVGLAKKGDFDG